MKGLLFSIVIPAYNEERFIGFCLQSLLDQDFPKERYEIIVVDNGSTDKTVQIAKSFGVRVLFEPKKGTVFARQKGSKIARGEIIVSFDADSEAPPDWLSKIEHNFRHFPRSIAVAGFYWEPGVPLFSKIYIEFFLRGLNFLSSKIFGHPLLVSATNFAFKKGAFLSCGGYPLDGGRPADQHLFLKRLKKLGRIIFDPTLMVATSSRRIKGRLLTSIVKDGILYTYLDPIFYKLTKSRLPGEAPDIRKEGQ